MPLYSLNGLMDPRYKVSTLFGIGTLWFIGGASYSFLSNLTGQIEPINIVCLRSTGAAIMMFMVVLATDRKSFSLIKFDKSMIPIVVSSLLFSPGCSFAIAWSSDYVPGAITALTYSTLPAMSVLFLLAKGTKPSKSSALGVFVATVSVVMLVGAPDGDIRVIGVLAALLSVLAWFVATEIWIKYESGYPMLLAIFLQLAIGAVGSWLIRPFFDAPAITGEQLLNPNLIFLTFGLASQYWAYLGISRRVSMAVLTSFAFVNPLVAGIVGFWVFNQKITPLQTVAGGILMVGLYLLVRDDLRTAKA